MNDARHTQLAAVASLEALAETSKTTDEYLSFNARKERAIVRATPITDDEWKWISAKSIAIADLYRSEQGCTTQA